MVIVFGSRGFKAFVAMLALSLLQVVPAAAQEEPDQEADQPDPPATSHGGGLAYNYHTHVGLFGGPPARRGYGQSPTAPASARTASVQCPAGGGSATSTQPGARAEYGPAQIFGGIWPWPDSPTAPPSGPQTSSITCVFGPGGHVTASTLVTLMPGATREGGHRPDEDPKWVEPTPTWSPSGSTAEYPHPGGIGPGPLIADEVASTCRMNADGTVTSDVRFKNGFVETSYDPDTQDPATWEDIPDHPTPGYTVSGTLDHIAGDPYHENYDIIFNEQIRNPDGSFTVNAARMHINGPIAVGEVVVGSSTCGPLTPQPDPNLEFVPRSPCAVFDTRFGTGTFLGKLAGGTSRTLQVTGSVPASQGGQSCTTPPANAVAVKMNLVALEAEAPGNLQIAAAGVSPEGGVVNFVPGPNNSNALPVEVSANGRVTVTNTAGGGRVHIRGVVLGYYTAVDAAGLEFVPVAPCAVFDTRFGTGGFAGRLGGGTSRTFQVTGTVPTSQGGAQCDAPPANAVAVEVNLAALTALGPGNLQIAAAGVIPQGGVVNFAPGVNNSNALPVGVSATGRVTVTNTSGGGAVHVRGVVLGYYTNVNGTGLEFVPVSPCAVFDSRFGTHGWAGKLPGGWSRTMRVTGSAPPGQGGQGCAVPPPDAQAVEVNLVAISPEGGGNLQIAAARADPQGGVVNFSAGGGNNSNALPVEVNVADIGRLSVFNTTGGGAVHIRGVILGYYVAAR